MGTPQRELSKREITPVETTDYFLQGFNADYPDKQPTSSVSQQWEGSRKELSHKGITETTADPQSYKYITGYDPLFDDRSRTPEVRALRENGINPIYDPFLDGFNEGYEDKQMTPIGEIEEREVEQPDILDLIANSYKYGYNNAARGQEAWKLMHGQKNELDKYNELLSSDEYNIETDSWWKNLLSGVSQQVGQGVRQFTDPATVTLATSLGSMALLGGQAGPQALLPEEILTVPTAFTLGMKAGNAKTNMEIEGGQAYLEMINNGVSEETARAIATGIGGVNAALDTIQLDELLKAYKILDKAGADDTLLDILLREVRNRSIDTAVETGQEVLQEATTIGGTQFGSKLDTGEWAYNLSEMLERLWDTVKESALTFSLTNIPSTVHNVSTQNHNRLVAAGEANILAGKMPTAEQLQAMNMSEAEALGKMAVLQMDELNDAADMYRVTYQEINDSTVAIPEEANDIAKQVQENNGTPPKGYKGGRTYNNIPKDVGAQKLPEGVSYKEYDIYPYIKGQNRGTERIVIGDDGSVWYTNDHYQTFTKIK